MRFWGQICRKRSSPGEVQHALGMSWTTSRAFRNSGQISSNPEAQPPRSCSTASVTSAPVLGYSAFSIEDMSAGLRKSSKRSFYRPVMSSVDISSTPPSLYTEFIDCWLESHWGRLKVFFPQPHQTPLIEEFLLWLLPNMITKLIAINRSETEGIVPNPYVCTIGWCGQIDICTEFQ